MHKNEHIKSKSIEFYKKMLLSRDIGEQMKAVNSIYKIFLYYEDDYNTYINLIDWLLTNDICVFLCEASITLQTDLLSAILKIFQIFAQNSNFHTKSYSSQVVTSLVRTIQFLIKENGSENVINELLCFTSDVFKKSKILHLPPIISRESIYNVIQIFELLINILDKTSYETQTKISIGILLHRVIEKDHNEVIITAKTLSYAKVVIEKCLHSLNQMLIISKYKCTVESKLELVFRLICELCIDSLYICDNCTIIAIKTSNQIVDDTQKSEMKNVVLQIVTEITSQMKEYELSVISPNIDVFLELLNDFLNQQDLHKDAQFSFVQHLCSHGFLAFFGKVASMSANTKKLCLMNLAVILSTLSKNAFNIDCTNDDEENFKRYFFEGFTEVGVDYELWPQIMSGTLASDSTAYSLIPYIYFHCLYSKRPETIVVPLLPSLVKFILQLPKKSNCPDPILKCLWLIFSIASLFNKDDTFIHGGVLRLQTAISTMCDLLNFKVKAAYTHHPLILLWTFSSHRISIIIRNQVLSLWFEKENTLPEDLADNLYVWYSLLEIIVVGGKETNLNTIQSLLKESIEKYSQENDSIRYELWDTLSHLLQKLSIGGSTNINSVLYLLELCISCSPTLPNLSTLQMIASLLPTLLTAAKQDNVDVEGHFMKGAFTILQHSLRHEDTWILSQYIETPIYLQHICGATTNEDAVISICAFKTLSITSYYKNKFNIKSPSFIQMDPTQLIIQLRDETNTQKITSILTFLYQHLNIENSNLKEPFTILATIHPKETFVQTYKALFFRLQMVCCKDLKQESQNSWHCLNKIMEFASIHIDIPELLIALTSLPWSHKLIHFYLYQNQAKKYYHKMFLKFVFSWLLCHKTLKSKNDLVRINVKEIFKPQAECDIMFITLGRIINAFNDETLLSNLPHNKRNIVNRILNLISENFS